METKFLLAIIITIVIILILFIIVVNPALLYAKGSGEQISFREFCFHWSICGYKCGSCSDDSKNPDILKIGKFTYSISQYCSKSGAPDPCNEAVQPGEDATCVKICKGAA